MQPKLSLIIPTYNAESFIRESILKIIEWRKNKPYEVEVLLINDGSLDQTQKIINTLNPEELQLKFISYTKNKGKGYAVKIGMNSAIGQYRIFTDADIPYGLNVIDDILEQLSSKNFDLCVGNRLDKASTYHTEMSFFRKMSSKVFTFFVTRFTIDSVGDTQCGIKGFTAKTANRIFSKTRINGFAFDVESIYLCYKYNLRIKRIPVRFQGNNITTIKLFNTSIRMLIDVLSLPVRFHILKNYRDF